MKSVLLHKWERRTHLTIFSFLIIFVIVWIANYVIPLDKQMVIYLLEIAYIICLGMTLFIYAKFRKWKRSGFMDSQNIGLKRITIFPTVHPNIYELHHRQGSFKEGFVLRKQSKKKIVDIWMSELRQDFKRLSELSQTKDLHFVSVTHTKMAQIWDGACHPHFNITSTSSVNDPYVKPFIWQWWFMSFSTTGRIASLPKKWGAILIYPAKRGKDIGSHS